ncbi:MAG: filamentous hemagglutinin N-terminal domain-containing protein, partial [Candidatus Omnitrophica bacterium]|nr:filamentous hemagglutinin N-terminal domain-containing protein [Candidatus Omnitrophota bacterium]
MRRVAAALLAANLIYSPSSLGALPQGYRVVEGEAVAAVEGPHLQLVVSDRAVLEFDSFSIAGGESVHFVQPTSLASVLSRVTGSYSSDIYGSLFANGELVFVNPYGITFHGGSDVQVGSLIASTLDIQNALYLAGQLEFERVEGLDPARIVQEGAITAGEGGHIALLSDSVSNSGTLEAYLGSIALGVGEKIAVSFDEQGLINLVIDERLANELLGDELAIANEGSITAKGGKVVLTAYLVEDVFDTLVNNTGLIEASRAEERDGTIYLLSNVGMENRETGILRSNVLQEEGATFGTWGTMDGGIDADGHIVKGAAFYKNLDGALTNLTGSIGSDQTDADNIVVTGNVTLTADNLTFTADSDGTGDGAFSMNASTQINGGNFNLTILTGANATLRTLTSMDLLTLGRTGSNTPTFTANNSIGLTGFTLNTGTALDLNGQTLTMTSGDWTNNGTFTANSGTVDLARTTGGTSGITGATTFYNLLVSNTAGTYSLVDSIIVTNDLTVSSTSSGNSIGTSTSKTLSLGGDLIHSGSALIDNDLLIIMDGSAVQTINASGGVAMGSLQISNTTVAVELASNVHLDTSLVIDDGAELDVTSGNYTFRVDDDWTNNGTFTARQGTVQFSRDTGGQSSITGSNATTFYNLEMNHTGGTVQFIANLTVENDWTVSSSSSSGFSATGTPTISVEGDVTYSSAQSLPAAFTTRMTGSGTQIVTTSSTGTLGDLQISNTSGEVQLGDDLLVADDITVDANTTFDLLGFSVTGAGGTTFSNSGTLQLHGDQTFTNATPTHASGSTVEYTDTTGNIAIQDWTYTSASLRINGGATYTMSAGEVIGGTL